MLAAALDDVDGAFEDRDAVDRARAEVETLRRREYVVGELFALAKRAALGAELAEAILELRRHEPDVVERKRVTYEPPTRGVRALPNAGGEPTATDLIAKAVMRAIATENSRDFSTPYSRASASMLSARARVERFDAEFPKLARVPGPVV